MQVPGQLGEVRDWAGGGPAAELAGGAGGGGSLDDPGQHAWLAAEGAGAVACLQGERADQWGAQHGVPVGRAVGGAGLQVGVGLGAGPAGLAGAAGGVQGLRRRCSEYLCWPGHPGPGILTGGGAPAVAGGLVGAAGRLRGDSGGRAGGGRAHLWAELGQAPHQEGRAVGTAWQSERGRDG